MNRPARRFPLSLDRVTAAAAAPSSAARPVVRPQRPVREAAHDAARTTRPVGQGLDSEAVRARMLDRLRAEGVDAPTVLAAMGRVPRDRFVDTAFVAQAYEDTSLPIGWEQTISKPIVVARMLALLTAGPGVRHRPIRTPLGRALEIGTGCGYQAAVLAQLASRVTSIERIGPLLDKARLNLAAVGCTDIRLVHGDGRLGHAPNAPYDSIVAAAGGESVPEAWLEQLAPGGRLVAPMHDEDADGQVLVVIDRTPDGLVRSLHDAVHFVPLKSGRL